MANTSELCSMAGEEDEPNVLSSPRQLLKTVITANEFGGGQQEQHELTDVCVKKPLLSTHSLGNKGK